MVLYRVSLETGETGLYSPSQIHTLSENDKERMPLARAERIPELMSSFWNKLFSST